MKILRKFTNLHTLELSFCQYIDDTFLLYLPTSLTKLNLSICPRLTNAGVKEALTRLVKLSSLNLQKIYINDSCLLPFPSSLTALYISETDISPAIFPYFTSLKILDIRR